MTRVLVVANRTASTPVLLAEVSARARAGASVTVLIPPERQTIPIGRRRRPRAWWGTRRTRRSSA